MVLSESQGEEEETANHNAFFCSAPWKEYSSLSTFDPDIQVFTKLQAMESEKESEKNWKKNWKVSDSCGSHSIQLTTPLFGFQKSTTQNSDSVIIKIN